MPRGKPTLAVSRKPAPRKVVQNASISKPTARLALEQRPRPRQGRSRIPLLPQTSRVSTNLQNDTERTKGMGEREGVMTRAKTYEEERKKNEISPENKLRELGKQMPRVLTAFKTIEEYENWRVTKGQSRRSLHISSDTGVADIRVQFYGTGDTTEEEMEDEDEDEDTDVDQSQRRNAATTLYGAYLSDQISFSRVRASHRNGIGKMSLHLYGSLEAKKLSILADVCAACT